MIEHVADFRTALQNIENRSRDLNLTVSQWASQHRRIVPPGWKTSETFNFDKTPWLRRPCDLLSRNSPCRSIVCIKGSRNGFSQGFIMNSMFYNMDVNPVKMMYVSADQKLLNNFVNEEIYPQLIKSGLQKKIRASAVNEKNKNKSSGQKAEIWSLGGDGYIVFAGANNPNNFRQLGAQYLYLDERATYPIIKSEGDIVDLARGRTSDYGIYAKTVIVSTPTVAGSEFEKEYLAGTCEEWQVPCPICGAMQYLDFGETTEDENGERELEYGLSFTHENYELRSDVRYKCRHCAGIFPEIELYKINLDGDWVPTKENSNPEDVSLKINSLYTPFMGWEEIAKRFLEAKRSGRPSKLQSFHNLVLGRFWEYKKRERITVDQMMEIKSGYSRSEVPAEVAMITAACDVQGDRLEIEWKGFGKNMENFSIEYETLRGDTSKFDVWNDFEKLIFTKKFAGITPLFYLIDESDGKRQKIIHEFIRSVNARARNESGNKSKFVAMALKGRSPKQIAGVPLRIVAIDDRLKRLDVNTYYFKERVVMWMESRQKWEEGTEKPHGLPNFPVDYPRKYYSQLNAEEMQIDFDAAGYEKTKWVAHSTRNEAFDLFCYNVAAIEFFYEFVVKPLEEQIKIYSMEEMFSYYLKKRTEQSA